MTGRVHRWACPYCKADNIGRGFESEELQKHYDACMHLPKPPAPPPRPPCPDPEPAPRPGFLVRILTKWFGS